eukprot:2673118-Pyramimonas_sp.AAC.1
MAIPEGQQRSGQVANETARPQAVRAAQQPAKERPLQPGRHQQGHRHHALSPRRRRGTGPAAGRRAGPRAVGSPCVASPAAA